MAGVVEADRGGAATDAGACADGAVGVSACAVAGGTLTDGGVRPVAATEADGLAEERARSVAPTTRASRRAAPAAASAMRFDVSPTAGSGAVSDHCDTVIPA